MDLFQICPRHGPGSYNSPPMHSLSDLLVGMDIKWNYSSGLESEMPERYYAVWRQTLPVF